MKVSKWMNNTVYEEWNDMKKQKKSGLSGFKRYTVFNQKYMHTRCYFTFYVTCPAAVRSPPLHPASAEISFMVAAGICWMGEGGRFEIAKLWEPWQCAEDEGSEGGKGGERAES